MRFLLEQLLKVSELFIYSSFSATLEIKSGQKIFARRINLPGRRSTFRAPVGIHLGFVLTISGMQKLRVFDSPYERSHNSTQFERKKRGPMKFRLQTAAAALLAASLVASYAYASDPTPPAKKQTTTKKAKMPPPPTVAEQIQALKDELEGQINSLKADLAAKDAQLKQAQQAAADAQAAADKAQAAAMAQQQAVTRQRSRCHHAAINRHRDEGRQRIGWLLRSPTKRPPSRRPSPIPACCITRASPSRRAAIWRVKPFTAPRPPAAIFPPPSAPFLTKAPMPIR